MDRKDQIIIKTPDIGGGYSRMEVKETRIKNDDVPCLRIYCTQYPNGYKLQVRGSVILETESRNHKPKARNLIASLELTLDQLREIAEFVNQLEKSTV